MDFQKVRNENGQQVVMFATLEELGAQKLSRQKKPMQSVKVTDDTGETHTITIFKGTGSLPTSEILGQRLQFTLKTYQGQSGLAYSGFWNENAQVIQQMSQLQQTKQPQKEVDWDAKDLRSARQTGVNCATQLVCTLAEISKEGNVTDDDILSVAEKFVKYIYDGIQQEEPPEPNDEEPPF